jgi:hypothetical protein
MTPYSAFLLAVITTQHFTHIEEHDFATRIWPAPQNSCAEHTACWICIALWSWVMVMRSITASWNWGPALAHATVPVIQPSARCSWQVSIGSSLVERCTQMQSHELTNRCLSLSSHISPKDDICSFWLYRGRRSWQHVDEWDWCRGQARYSHSYNTATACDNLIGCSH